MMRIFLADLVHDYLMGNYVVPLNIGYLAARLQKQFGTEVDTRLFKSPSVLLDALGNEPAPHVIGFSNYSWNQELNKRMIEKVKSKWPDTIVCSGGPHIRTDEKGIADYLRAHPSIDYYCMFEGEAPFAALIGHFLATKPMRPSACDADLTSVAYLRDDELVYSHIEARKGAIEGVPSPYLSGVLDEFLESDHWVPLFETNRGCPFHCTFCVWGISAMDKVRTFPLEESLENIRYVAERSPARRWIFADANFGMLPRDVDIAREIRHNADKYGRLSHAQMWFAKNSSRKTVEIARTLGSLTDPLAAVQSMDPAVLKNIKRANIKLTTMTDLLDEFHRNDLNAATDVLVGLPGESLEAHLDSLRKVFTLGFDVIDVGTIRLLPGSEMENDETRETFGLETKYRLIPGSYGKYHGEPIVEYEEAVRATKDLSEEEMLSLRIVHFFVWSLSNLGMARSLLFWLYEERGRNPVDVMLALAAPGRDAKMDSFIAEFNREARDEWFDTPEELVEHYTEGFDDLERNGFLKLNAKYVAKILLDRNFAKSILNTIAKEIDSPIAPHLVQFCLDRLYFLDDRAASKQRDYPPELVEFLKRVYPDHTFESLTCQLDIGVGTQKQIEYELDKYSFDNDPVRGLTLTMESVRTSHFLYEFQFGRAERKKSKDPLVGSFDYDIQLNT